MTERAVWQSTIASAILAAAVLAFAGLPAEAADKDDCYSRDVERVLKGCTRVIGSRGLNRPDLADAHAARAGGHFDKRDYAAAERDIAKALEADPNNGLAWAWRGHIQNRRKQFEPAIQSFDRSVRATPKDAGAWEGRALARLMTGNAQGAVEDADRSLQLDPKVAIVYVTRARARMALSQYEAAFGDFARAAAVDEKLDDIYLYRAELHRRVGKPKEARADIDRAIAIDGEEAEPVGLRGFLKGEDGDVKGAIADLSRAVALEPDNGTFQAGRALYAIADRDIDGALRHAGRAIALGHAEGFEVRGLVQQAMGDHVQAISDFGAALEKSKGESINALLGRARSYAAAGFHTEARADLERARKLKAVMPRDHQGLAAVNTMLGDYTGANLPPQRPPAKVVSVRDQTRQPLVQEQAGRSKQEPSAVSGERRGGWTLDLDAPGCAVRFDDKGRFFVLRTDDRGGILLVLNGAMFGVRPGGVTRVPAVSFVSGGGARIAADGEPVIVPREGARPAASDIHLKAQLGLVRQLLSARELAIAANGRTERFVMDEAPGVAERFNVCAENPRAASQGPAEDELTEFKPSEGKGAPPSSWTLMGNERIGYCVLRQTLPFGYVDYRRNSNGTIRWTWSDARIVTSGGIPLDVAVTFDDSQPVAWRWRVDRPDQKRGRVSATLTMDWLAASLSRFDKVALLAGAASASFSYQGLSGRFATLERCAG